MITNNKIGLYVHIPFCLRKCNYCDFYSLACPNKRNLTEYVSCICAHMEREAHLYRNFSVDTIFFGGGTPSILDCDDFKRICDTIKKCFKLTQGAEFSIEANPCTVTREKLETIKSCGVNRISIGLQSANEDELKVLGRLHSLDDFERAFSLAREVGFDNISVDIMFALPEQTTEKLSKTIDYVSKFEPEHISSYCLKIESGTPFSKMDLVLPNEDTQYEMYLEMCKRLKSLGYEQYEISNFAKDGHRCAHNLKYWLSNEYVGFGPASHSFFGGVRYSFEGDIQKYCSAIQDGGVPKKVLEEVNDPTFEERMDEYVMLRMRLADGVSLDEFKARFGIEFDSVYDIEKYEKSNHIIRKNGTVSFSTEGFFVSNFILSDILKNI